MPKLTDPRTIPAQRVHAYATLVTFTAKCRRLNEADWKTKLVLGTVTKVIRVKINIRNQTSIQPTSKFLDYTKLVTLCIDIVKADEAAETAKTLSEDITPGENEQALQIVSESPITMPNVTEDNTICMRSSDMMLEGAPLTAFHGRNWFLGNITLQINEYVANRKWKVGSLIDGIISHGRRPSRMHSFDVFMWMFLQNFFPSIVHVLQSTKLFSVGLTY